MTKKNKIILISSIVTVSIIIVLTIFMLTREKEQKTYTVNFDSNGGSIISEQLITEGEYVQKPKDPQKEGYIFIEWRYNGEKFNFNTTIDKNIALEAVWQKLEEDKEMIKISFNTDGGSTISNQVIEKGKTIEKPEDPTKEGYTFKHWSYNEEEFNFEITISKDTELLAIWEEIPKQNNQTNTNTNTGNNNKPNNNTNTNGGNNTQNKVEEIKLATPTLSNSMGNETGKIINAKLHIGIKGEYSTEESWNKISGWELYEKVGNEYKLVDSKEKTYIEVTVDIGEKKTYVARAYALNSKGIKIYSAYSNEIVFDNSKIATPTLSNSMGNETGKIINAKLHIGIKGEYSTEESWNTISGWELYEKVGSEYKLVDSKEKTYIEVNVDIGEKKTYVARAYALNSKGIKIYSAYSNEIAFDNTNIATPTLSNSMGNETGKIINAKLHIGIVGEYSTEESWNKISGWELYEKVGSEYKLVNSKEKTYIEVNVDIGEKKTYVARAYALNSKGIKIYSAYSNEIVIDNTNNN